MAAKAYRLEVWQAARGRTAGQWYWRVRARNGRTVADGSESYHRRKTMLGVIAKAFAGSAIGDQAAEMLAEK